MDWTAFIVRLVTTWRATIRLTMTQLTTAVWCGGAALALAPIAALADASPPSIETVVIAEGGRTDFEGDGQPGDVVRLLTAGAQIGETRVGADGRWRVVLTDGLKPGTHQIRADAHTGSEGPVAEGDEIRIAIPIHMESGGGFAYDGSAGTVEPATRQRAEDLAQAAGEAFDDVVGGRGAQPPLTQSPNRIAGDEGDGSAEVVEQTGPIGVLIEWLKRSARGYREDVVSKLGNPTAGSVADAQREVPKAVQAEDRAVSGVADTIAKERAEAEARRIALAEAESVRQALDADTAAADAAKREALKQRRTDDLARRKAEQDKRIAEDLERLKKAKEEADRAKAASASAPQRATITLERFYLPGEKKPAAAERRDQPESLARAAARRDQTSQQRFVRRPSRCSEGRVIHRRGQRWYVTGANDTLWGIAERYYGSGTAYPRIFKVNRKRLASPHIVRPCLALRLPGR